MILLVTWLMFAAVLCVHFRKRPIVWITIALAGLVLLPRVATRSWFAGAGQLGALHPSIWLLLIGAIATVASQLPLHPVAHRTRLASWYYASWVVFAVLVILWLGYPPSSFVFNYALPALVVVGTMAAVARTDAKIWRKLAVVVTVIAAVEGLIAVLEYTRSSVLAFEQYYARNYWWSSYRRRSVGTMDSPLDLASFLTMSLAFVSQIRRAWVAALLALLIAGGILVTGSRVGIIAGVATLILLILGRVSGVTAKFAALFGAVGLGFILISTSVFITILFRFGQAGDASDRARQQALDSGLDLLAARPWSGFGPGYAYNYGTTSLISSFENSYLSTAIDYGIPIAAGLVLVQISLILKLPFGSWILRTPALLAIAWGFAYSSFLSSGNFGLVSAVIVAISLTSGMLVSSGTTRVTAPLGRNNG